MGELDIRRAHVSDVEDVLGLINNCATSNLMLPRGPKYLYENIRDLVVVEAQAGVGGPKIAACGSLHVLWKDTAEIRSLVTHPEFRGQGLGSSIVRYLVEDAKGIGIEEVIALTLVEGLFKRLGFRRARKGELPSKIWDECSRCPKYFQCDEIGLILRCGQGD